MKGVVCVKRCIVLSGIMDNFPVLQISTDCTKMYNFLPGIHIAIFVPQDQEGI